jgi:hypothetical protein
MLTATLSTVSGLGTVLYVALNVARRARLHCIYGPLAQLAEQRTFNPRVQGSIPWRPTPFHLAFRSRVGVFIRVIWL